MHLKKNSSGNYFPEQLCLQSERESFEMIPSFWFLCSKLNDDSKQKFFVCHREHAASIEFFCNITDALGSVTVAFF